MRVDKDCALKKTKIVFEENKRLLNCLKFEKEKVTQVEEELRELLRERQEDKLNMQKKLKALSENFM